MPAMRLRSFDPVRTGTQRLSCCGAGLSLRRALARLLREADYHMAPGVTRRQTERAAADLLSLSLAPTCGKLIFNGPPAVRARGEPRDTSGRTACVILIRPIATIPEAILRHLPWWQRRGRQVQHQPGLGCRLGHHRSRTLESHRASPPPRRNAAQGSACTSG